MNLPVMVPGLDRAHLLAWARRIDAGPFTTLAAGERGPGAAAGVAPRVRATSAASLREVARQAADAGADELCLVPTTLDVEELDRVADALG